MRAWLWLVVSGCASAPQAEAPPGPAQAAVWIPPAPREVAVEEHDAPPEAPSDDGAPATEPPVIVDSASEDMPFPLYHAPPGWMAPPPAPPPGSIVHDAFRRAAKRCFEIALKTHPALGGRIELVIRFRDQRPIEVRVSAPPTLATLGVCLQRAAAHLQVDGNDEVTLTVPINLAP